MAAVTAVRDRDRPLRVTNTGPPVSSRRRMYASSSSRRLAGMGRRCPAGLRGQGVGPHSLHRQLRQPVDRDPGDGEHLYQQVGPLISLGPGGGQQAEILPPVQLRLRLVRHSQPPDQLALPLSQEVQQAVGGGEGRVHRPGGVALGQQVVPRQRDRVSRPTRLSGGSA